MKVLQKNFKLIYREKICLLSYILYHGLGISYLLYILVQSVSKKSAVYSMGPAYHVLRETSALVNYMVPAVLFFSLLVFHINKQAHVQEIVAYIDIKKDIKAKILALCTGVFFMCSSIFLINLLAYWFNDIKFGKAFLWQMACYIFVNYFLVGVLMILLGAVLSFLPKSIYQIVIALVFSCLFGGFWKEFIYLNVKNKEVFYRLYGLIQILTPGGGEWSIHSHLGLAVQLHQIILLTFWGAFCALLLTYFIRGGKRVTAGIFCLSFLLLFLPYEELGQSYYFGNGRWYPYYHYNNLDGEKYPAEFDKEKPSFEIEEYNMEFTTLTCLRAQVEIKVKKTDLNQYEFTLYHPYKIHKITDQDGKKLTYDRVGDYVTVYPKKELKSIRFQYYGNAKELYSQINGINLLPGICYYPIPGFHEIYGEGDYFKVTYLPNPVKFYVKVNSPLQVYTTLERMDNNYFEGEADTIGIFAGLIEETKAGDTRFIHSQTEQLEFGGFTSYVDVVEYADILYDKSDVEALNFHNKTVIAVPAPSSMELPIYHGQYILFSDTVRIYEMDYMAEREMNER